MKDGVEVDRKGEGAGVEERGEEELGVVADSGTIR